MNSPAITPGRCPNWRPKYPAVPGGKFPIRTWSWANMPKYLKVLASPRDGQKPWRGGMWRHQRMHCWTAIDNSVSLSDVLPHRCLLQWRKLLEAVKVKNELANKEDKTVPTLVEWGTW